MTASPACQCRWTCAVHVEMCKPVNDEEAKRVLARTIAGTAAIRGPRSSRVWPPTRGRPTTISVADRGVPPARLVLFGESLGAAVATRLAEERPVGGLVLRSPFTSLADVGALHYPLLPVRALLRDRYPVREHGRLDHRADHGRGRGGRRDRTARAEPSGREHGGPAVPAGTGRTAQRPGLELRRWSSTPSSARRDREPRRQRAPSTPPRTTARGPLPGTTRSISSPSV